AIYSNRAVSSSSREKPSWLRSWSMTRSPFLWTFSPTQHVRKTGFSSLLFPAADGPRGAPRGPSSPHTSHALYRNPYAFSQFRDCPVTIDSHSAAAGPPAEAPAGGLLAQEVDHLIHAGGDRGPCRGDPHGLEHGPHLPAPPLPDPLEDGLDPLEGEGLQGLQAIGRLREDLRDGLLLEELLHRGRVVLDVVGEVVVGPGNQLIQPLRSEERRVWKACSA